MAGHVSVECDPAARRVVESFYPDTIFHDDVSTVNDEFVQHLALRFSNAGLVILGGGPPCQGVSGLNSDKRGELRDHRSCLFKEVPRIRDLVRKRFIWAQVQLLMESVASMDKGDRQVMSTAVELQPWRIDSLGLTLCRRPRLTWELQSEEGVEVLPPEDEFIATMGEVKFQPMAKAQALIEGGWHLAGSCLPTFTTARPSETERWSQDKHRFPPYQYSYNNGLVSSSGEWRLPSVKEREVLMGFPVDYTKMCWNHSRLGDSTCPKTHWGRISQRKWPTSPNGLRTSSQTSQAAGIHPVKVMEMARCYRMGLEEEGRSHQRTRNACRLYHH